MGQKVNAVGLRIGINRGWEANWYASKKDYATFLGEDIAIRRYLEPLLKEAVVSHIDIARSKKDKGASVIINAFVARPGIVLGQDKNQPGAFMDRTLRPKHFDLLHESTLE